MMDLETLWYEVSPYIYAIAGVLALISVDSRLSTFSGGLLILAALTVIRLRWSYRKQRTK